MVHIDGEWYELNSCKVLFALGEILLDVGTYLLKIVLGLDGYLVQRTGMAVDTWLASEMIRQWIFGY